jgi:hypothetical protein
MSTKHNKMGLHRCTLLLNMVTWLLCDAWSWSSVLTLILRITPLYQAAGNGVLSSVQCLVEECGADVNQATPDASTPLIVATATKHRRVFAYLLNL